MGAYDRRPGPSAEPAKSAASDAFEDVPETLLDTELEQRLSRGEQQVDTMFGRPGVAVALSPSSQPQGSAVLARDRPDAPPIHEMPTRFAGSGAPAMHEAPTRFAPPSAHEVP